MVSHFYWNNSFYIKDLQNIIDRKPFFLNFAQLLVHYIIFKITGIFNYFLKLTEKNSNRLIKIKVDFVTFNIIMQNIKKVSEDVMVHLRFDNFNIQHFWSNPKVFSQNFFCLVIWLTEKKYTSIKKLFSETSKPSTLCLITSWDRYMALFFQALKKLQTQTM